MTEKTLYQRAEPQSKPERKDLRHLEIIFELDTLSGAPRIDDDWDAEGIDRLVTVDVWVDPEMANGLNDEEDASYIEEMVMENYAPTFTVIKVTERDDND